MFLERVISVLKWNEFVALGICKTAQRSRKAASDLQHIINRVAYDCNPHHGGKEGRQHFVLRGFDQLRSIDEKRLTVAVRDRTRNACRPRMIGRLKKDLEQSK